MQGKLFMHDTFRLDERKRIMQLTIIHVNLAFSDGW